MTGIAVGNPTPASVSVTFTAYQPDGSLLGSGATNPSTVTIPAGGVHTKLSTQIFGEVNFNGWVQATSSTTGLTGFFLNLSGSSDLDGAGSTVPSSDILIPLAVEDTTVRTELTILNVNPEAATATATLYSQAGAVLLTKEVSLPSRGLLRQTLSDLFSAVNFSAASHLRISSNRPVVVHEVVANFQIPGNTLIRETGALTGRDPSPEKNYILPHFVSGGGWLSLIGLVNGSAITQEVTLTAYKDDGTLWTAGTNPRTVTLAGNGALRTTAGDVFGFPGNSLTSGWIKVTSTLGFVSSYIGYGFETSSSLGMVEGTPAGNATRFAVFSHVAESLGYFTGLAVVNPGNEPADVEFYTLRADGSTVGKSTFSVGPNQHTARLFREFVPGSLDQNGGWGYLRSSKPVIGLVLFGTTNGSALGNVPQQLPAGDFVPPAQTSAAITGTVRAAGTGVAGVTLQLTGPLNQSTTTDTEGRYAFKLLPAGSYKVTASAGTSLVTPAERLLTLATQNVDGVDFETQGGVEPSVPSILFVTPSSAFAGTGTLSMRVLGGSFTPFSKVQVNGVEQTTSFVSSVELQAVVAASAFAQAGTMSVRVVTPGSAAPSAALAFTVLTPPDHPLIQGTVGVKSAPAGVAIDASRQQALVTNESSDSVLFIDIPTLTVVGEVTVGRSPAEGIDIHPGKDIAIVANIGSDSVSVIDLKTRTVTSIPVGRAPIGVAINPKTNRAYVINRDENTLTAINLDTMAVLGKADTRGGKPSGIAINTISNQLVVANRETNTVTHLNAVPEVPTFAGLLDVGKSPRMIAFNEDTNMAVVANAGDNTITIIDMATRQVRTTVAVGTAPTGVAIHRLTNNVVVTNSVATAPNQNNQSTVTIMNLDNRADRTDLTVGAGAFGVAIDQQRQLAVVANFFSNDAIAFRIPNPQPSISDIEPKTFPVGGGSFTITIKGTGFVPTSVIKLNGQSLPTIYISPTELRGTVSGALLDQLLQVSNIEAGDGKKGVVFRAGAPQFNVSISNPCPCGDDGGESPAPNPNNPNTTIQPTNPSPVLLSLSPTEIVVGNPLVLTLNGSGLNATSTINFGGLQLTPDAASVNALVVTIPANQLTAGDVPVSISNPSPGGGTTQVLTFKVIAQPNPSPAVTNVSPGSVNAGSGAHTITVTGTGFIASTTASLGGVVGVVNGNAITFTLTAGMTADPGTLSGSVSNPGPGGGSATFVLNIVSVVPSITDFNPKTANSGIASATIEVTGANFRNGSVITFGDIPIPTTFVSATQLSGQISEALLRQSGEFRIGVRNAPPGGGSVQGGLFTVTGLSPTLALISPAKTFRRTTPLTVQLTGTGFASTTTVSIGATRLDAVFVSSTSMTATIPAALLNAAGTLNVTVTNPPPGGGTSAPLIFTVENATPVVDSVTPNSIAGNLTSVVITVNGRDFVSGAAVQFGSTRLLTTFVSSTQLTAVLPSPLPYGRHAVTVVNPLPSTVSNVVFIDVNALKPVIDAITPSPTRGGQLIHITGRNFGPNSVILLLGAIAFPTTYVDTTTLTGVLPLTAPIGPSAITVLNPAAFEGAIPLVSDPVTLSILSGTPVISDYSPRSGVEGSAVRIDISGANFFAGATIQLGGIPLVTTVISPTELFGTGTLGLAGDVSLTVMNVGGTPSNPVPFHIAPIFVPPPPPPVDPSPLPTVSSIFPGGALVHSETLSINLTGTNFIALTTVTFNGVPLTITARSATSLTATVPASLLATGGTRPVVVTNPAPGGGSATTTFIVNTVQLSPVTVERIPGGTQQFVLINPPTGTFTWSVNSADGGSSIFGTISSGGLYTAPSTVPTPATFPVCARLNTNSAVNACATVTIKTTPSAGNDMVVFNDVNPFDNTGMSDANNRLMARNLVNFTGVGPRSSGTVVQFDCGRNSVFSSMCSSATTMKSEMESLGMTVTTVNSSSTARITSIPADVKALFLWLPTTNFAPSEVNVLKNFAENGGRIVFIGEYAGFYGTTGLNVENDLLLKMGAVMKNIGQDVDCGFNVVPASRLRPHQVTTGMTQVTIACASVITLGENDFPLFYDQTNEKVLAGVAKIDVTPLPTVIPLITSIEPSSGPLLASTTVTLRGTGFIPTCVGCPVDFGTNIAAGTNVTVSHVMVVNPTTVTATFTPAFNATLGSKAVTATTQNGLGGGVNWTVTAAPAPIITSLSPTSSVRNASVSVTVTGQNFTTGASAAITGTEVTLGTPLVHSSTSMTIQFTVASNAPIGVRHLSVTTGGGTSAGSPFAVVESNLFTTFDKVWAGGAAGAVTDWATAANWQPSGVPANGHNVFIPGGLPNNPVVSESTGVRDIYVAPGATLTLGEGVFLNSQGHVFAGQTINGAGTLQMTGASKFLAGTVPGLAVTGTVTGMSGSSSFVKVLNNMVVHMTGNYTVGNTTLEVVGSLSLANSATLTMTSGGDFVKVGGLTSFTGGSTEGKLTAGAIEVKGGFVQGGGSVTSFAASGTHSVKFSGNAPQTLLFANPGTTQSRFQNVSIELSGTGGAVVVDAGASATALGNLSLGNANAKLSGDGSFTALGNLPQIASGAQLTIANLTIGGNVDARRAIGGGTTVVSMTGSGKTFEGTVNGDLVINGTVSLFSGPSLITKSLKVNSGQFDINGKVLTVDLDVMTSGSGTLKMTNSIDSLTVGRNATFEGGATSGFLTAGRLSIKGNFTQRNTGGSNQSFRASGSHVTQFIGSGDQVVDFQNATESGFFAVELANATGGQVKVNSGKTAMASGQMYFTTASKLVGDGTFAVGTSFSTASGGTVSIANLIVGGNVDATNGIAPTLLTMTGTGDFRGTLTGSLKVTGTTSLILNSSISGSVEVNTGGLLDMGSSSLTVGLDFATQGSGKLKMTTPGAALNVGRDAIFEGGSTGGLLTAGMITVGRHFVQNSLGAESAPDNFGATGSHTVKFVGTSAQNITFTTPGPTNSRFQNVEIANSGVGSVSVPSGNSPLALGNLLLSGNGKLGGAGTFSVNGSFTGTSSNNEVSLVNLMVTGGIDASTGVRMLGKVTARGGNLKGSFLNDVEIFGTVQLNGSLGVLDSTLLVTNGSLELNGFTALVAKTTNGTVADFRTSETGFLKMMNANDRLIVHRNVIFDGASTEGQLNFGVIEIGGSFTQSTGGGSSKSFSATVTHRTKFIGSGLTQNVGFASSSKTDSHFGILDISNTAGGEVQILTGSDVQTHDLAMPLTTSKLRLSGILRYDGTILSEPADGIINRDTNLIRN